MQEMEGTDLRPRQIIAVLPALDEEQTVGAQVTALLAHAGLRALGLRQVVVVDNGSADRTADVAAAAGAAVVREPRRGYGQACLAGVLAARAGSIVLLMDADGSDDLDGAARVAGLVVRGSADLAVGSRVRGRVEPGALTPQQRVGNALAAVLLRLLAGLRVSDLGPVRAIQREALLGLGMREMTYGWSTEMLIKAARAGYRVVETPVDYHRRAGGRSKVAGTLVGTLRASRSILATIARYARWRPAAPIGPPAHRPTRADRRCPSKARRGAYPVTRSGADFSATGEGPVGEASRATHGADNPGGRVGR